MRGYVLKGADGDETLRAIRAVGTGEAIFSPAIATHLMQYFTTPRQKSGGPALPPVGRA